MKTLLLAALLALATTSSAKPPANTSGYQFQRGFPITATAQKAAQDIELSRAVDAYRFFYPTVSGAAIIKGNDASGLVDNKVFGYLDTKPHHVIFTANSDTPYGPIAMNLKDGPMVVEMPAGPLIVVSMDMNQRWVADMGIPGPDAGKGGKHLILPPGYQGKIPDGFHVWKATTNRLIIGVRSLPVNGDIQAALDRIQTIKVYPLNPPTGWSEPKWINLTSTPTDTTPLKWEKNIKYWEALHEVIETEPLLEAYRNYYGELAALGIEKGKPFKPDARMKKILENAAQIGNAQMRVESFADTRPDRLPWKDRKWEWAALRFEDGDFNAANFVDLTARDKWFYQAIGASPAMFRRQEGQGSVYWLGARDKNSNYLDGGKSYRLSIPQPVPAGLFWSVTVYDTETRSQIQTAQGKAALRSLFELNDLAKNAPAELYFGPKAPVGKERQWIQTIPGKGWFAYIRVYGPQKAAFDGTWKPNDIEEQRVPMASN